MSCNSRKFSRIPEGSKTERSRYNRIRKYVARKVRRAESKMEVRNV